MKLTTSQVNSRICMTSTVQSYFAVENMVGGKHDSLNRFIHFWKNKTKQKVSEEQNLMMIQNISNNSPTFCKKKNKQTNNQSLLM